MPERRCPLCIAAYGKTGRPDDFGNDPECAFPDGRTFGENWMCSTMSALREIAAQNRTCHEDVSVGVVPFESDEIGCGFIVLKWYKSRGATDMAALLHQDDAPRRITLQEAEAALRYHGKLTRPELRRIK